MATASMDSMDSMDSMEEGLSLEQIKNRDAASTNVASMDKRASLEQIKNRDAALTDFAPMDKRASQEQIKNRDAALTDFASMDKRASLELAQIIYRQHSKMTHSTTSTEDPQSPSSSGFIKKIIFGITATGSFLFGFNLAVFNTSMEIIGKQWRWCPLPGDTDCSKYKVISSILQTVVFLGAASGSITGGYLLGWGSRMLYLYSLVIMAIGVLFSVTATHYINLGLARLVVGLGVGLISVAVPTYMAEMTPPLIRIYHQLFITVGIFLAVILGLPFQSLEDGQTHTTFNRVWWRVLLGSGLIPVVVGAILFISFFNFETPFYYLTAGDEDKAVGILRRILGRDDVEEDLIRIREQIEISKKARITGLSFMQAMASNRFRRIIIIGAVLAAGQQLTGINAFITNSNKLFDDAGLDDNLVTYMSVLLTFINLVMTFPPLWLIERLGRKNLLLYGTIGMGASTLVGAIMLFINSDSKVSLWIAIAGAFIFICFFSATYGPVLWVYLFECFPSEIKDSASGASTATNWIIGIAMVFAANYMSTKIAYIVFAVLNFVIFLFILFFVKETKGRTVGDSPYLYTDPEDKKRRRFSIWPARRPDWEAKAAAVFAVVGPGGNSESAANLESVPVITKNFFANNGV